MRRTIIAAFTILSAARCATVAHGRYQNVPVDSNPHGAAVRVTCGDRSENAGTTPVVIRLLRSDRCNLTLTREGYKDAPVVFDRLPAKAFWWNFGFGGAAGIAVMTSEVSGLIAAAASVPGLLIDAVSGARWRQEPTRVDVTLEPNR